MSSCRTFGGDQCCDNDKHEMHQMNHFTYKDLHSCVTVYAEGGALIRSKPIVFTIAASFEQSGEA